MAPPTAIRGELLDLICECSRDQHPYEFAAVLRQEGDTITELLPLPGGIAGDEHAILPEKELASCIHCEGFEE
ncbi:MAG: hypothetical protein QGH21_04425 [Candidatus Poseidoniia archaeon]|nr:hypothetical protein [Candidatus Poseidoniia archaeon]